MHALLAHVFLRTWNEGNSVYQVSVNHDNYIPWKLLATDRKQKFHVCADFYSTKNNQT